MYVEVDAWIDSEMHSKYRHLGANLEFDPWIPWIRVFPEPGLEVQLIELDDGKILTGNPDLFDGKNPWVSG